MHIRPAEVVDAIPITEILRNLGWFPFLNELPFDEVEIMLQNYIKHCHDDNRTDICVAETDNQTVVGFVVVDWRPTLAGGWEGFISQLYVAEFARSQSVGTHLLNEVRALALKKGGGRLMLYIRRQRPAYQRQFYQHNGWIERNDGALFILETKP